MKHLEDSKVPSNLCNRGGREEVLMPVIQTEDWEEGKESNKNALSVPNSQTLERRKVSFDEGSLFDIQSPGSFRSQLTGESYPRKNSKFGEAAAFARDLPPVENIDYGLHPSEDSGDSVQSLQAPIYQMSEDSDLMSSSTSDGDSGPDAGLSFPNTPYDQRQNSLNSVTASIRIAPTLSNVNTNTDQIRKTSAHGSAVGLPTNSDLSTQDYGPRKLAPYLTLGATNVTVHEPPTKPSTPRVVEIASLSGSKETLSASDSPSGNRPEL